MRAIDNSISRLPYAAHRVVGECDPDSPFWREARGLGCSMRLEANSIFQPFDCQYFYCVESGALRSDFVSQSGRQRSLLIFETGSIINLEQAILLKPGSATYLALADARLWRLDRSLVLERAHEHIALARQCLSILSSISLTYQAALTLLDVDDFKMRFCRYLALNIRKHGSGVFCLGITQDECAATLGVHRATLARAVQSLKKDRVLASFTSQRVEILDETRLMELAGF